MFWLSGAKWLGTVCGVAGAIMIALNLGVVVYGFALFLVSSVLWGHSRADPTRTEPCCAAERIHGRERAGPLALGGMTPWDWRAQRRNR